MTWDWFRGKLTYRGSEYFAKSVEFEKFWDLPRRIKYPLTLAINGMKAPLKKIADEGWRVEDAPWGDSDAGELSAVHRR